MNISMIAAMGKNRVIGKDNEIPWKLPAEQQYFKKVTIGHAVVSGRKNFESMGKPLKGRRNMILTRNKDFQADGCEVVSSVEDVLRMFEHTDEEVFIIGGEEIYRLFLPHASRLFLTIIDEEFEGDTYFPEFSCDDWKQVYEQAGLTDEQNPYRYVYRLYEKL